MPSKSAFAQRLLVFCRDALGFLYQRVLLAISPRLANFIYDRLPHRWLVYLLGHHVLGAGTRSFDWVVTLKSGRPFKVAVEADERFSKGCAFEYKAHDVGLKRVQEFLLDRADKRSLYLDLGANIGVSSVYALSAGLRCWLFEPNKELHPFGKRLFAHNGFTKARWEAVALSDAPGEAHFFVSKSSFLSSFDKANAEREGAPTEIVVPVRTLDSYLDELRAATDQLIIKIDVEGHEMNLLAGGSAVLAAYRPPVMLELLNNEPQRRAAWTFFAERGYVCRGIFDEPILRLQAIASPEALAAFPSINYVFLPSQHPLLAEMDGHQ